jgi:hypothetical protein
MMLLRDLMLADLERGLAIARDGHEVVPAWRILAPEGDLMPRTWAEPETAVVYLTNTLKKVA